jgi:tetratricopeptide (TPR) repeat protein
MMLDRKKLSFWTRIAAIALAVIFVGSFIFLGIGTSLNYNLFELLSGSSKGKEESTTAAADEQISRAQNDLEADPQNYKIIRRLAGLYLQNGQTDSAVEVLEQGREVAPDDPVIPLYLGQTYDQKAQALTDEDERKATYQKAGDAYAAATENKGDQPQAYLAAGQAYEQAGEKGKAIQYYNGYLKVQPESTQADAVKEHITTLLKGGETTGGAAGGAK